MGAMFMIPSPGPEAVAQEPDAAPAELPDARPQKYDCGGTTVINVAILTSLNGTSMNIVMI